MDMNKTVLLLMLCAPMLAGAQRLTFSDHEPLGNMRTRVTERFFRLVEQESEKRIRIDDHWNGEIASSYDARRVVSEGTKTDMAAVVPEYNSQQLPLHQLFKSFPAGSGPPCSTTIISPARMTRIY